MVKEKRPALDWLRIYGMRRFILVSIHVVAGEIFGGSYPSKEVAAVKNASVVQRGIWYCPHNDFYAFDLHDGTGYLDVDLATAVLKECGFFYALPLFRGTLADALKYPNTFVTTIPALFKLPALADNIAEGVVIKPAVDKKFSNGNRVVFKVRNVTLWIMICVLIVVSRTRPTSSPRRPQASRRRRRARPREQRSLTPPRSSMMRWRR
jgi:hypothetical protein